MKEMGGLCFHSVKLYHLDDDLITITCTFTARNQTSFQVMFNFREPSFTNK